MEREKLKAYAMLHFCVLIWGFTAILGKLISLPTLPLVWWRVLICCATLLLVMPRAQLRALRSGQFWALFRVGTLVALHWLCFYGAVKLANASVAVASIATTSFFAALMEPLLLKKPLKTYELALGIFILPGMALVAGDIDWSMRAGLAVGIVGAWLAAVFTALNKKILDHHPPPPLAMSWVELFAVLVVCSVAAPAMLYLDPAMAWMPQGWDWLWILVLAWACTLLPYYLTLLAMRHISAFATNLTLNLEPVYGVLLAALLFREDKTLGTNFYLGMAMILLAVFGHPFLKKRFEPALSA
jgi:drug/metabolite transporter (DMT)-like permease